MSRRVADEIEVGRNPVEQIRIRGELSVNAGFMVTMVAPADPDDPTKIEALRRAAQLVLGIAI